MRKTMAALVILWIAASAFFGMRVSQYFLMECLNCRSAWECPPDYTGFLLKGMIMGQLIVIPFFMIIALAALGLHCLWSVATGRSSGTAELIRAR